VNALAPGDLGKGGKRIVDHERTSVKEIDSCR